MKPSKAFPSEPQLSIPPSQLLCWYPQPQHPKGDRRTPLGTQPPPQPALPCPHATTPRPSLADALGQGSLPAEARLALRAVASLHAGLLQALALSVDGDLGRLEGRAGVRDRMAWGGPLGMAAPQVQRWDGRGCPLLTSLRALSSSTSRGGMMMERLGGFLLCRRLLLERLPPFLSPADILGRWWSAGCKGARSQREGKKYPRRSSHVGKGWLPAGDGASPVGSHQPQPPAPPAVLLRPCHHQHSHHTQVWVDGRASVPQDHQHHPFSCGEQSEGWQQ